MPQLRDAFRREKEAQREIDIRVQQEAMRTTEEEAGFIQSILKEVSTRYRDQIASAGLEIPEELNSEIRKTVSALCGFITADYETKRRVERLAIANITGLGVITPYMQDPEVTEIVVQRWNNIVIERKGRIERVEAAFMNAI